jgi:hypothetical protein
VSSCLNISPPIQAASGIDSTFYISPETVNLAILHTADHGDLFHASTNQIIGSLSDISTQPIGAIRVDLRRLEMAQNRTARRFIRLFDPFTHPYLTIHLTSITDWPDSIPGRGDTTIAIAMGVISLHDRQDSVQMPLRICCARTTGDGALNGFSIFTKYHLRPARFGIDVPERLMPLMSGVELQLILDARPLPTKTSSGAYNWMRGEAFIRGQQLGFAEVDEAMLLLAAVQSDERVKNLLTHLSISPVSFSNEISTRLEALRPDSTSNRIKWSDRARRLVNWDAHFEAHRLGSAMVRPEHFLLALLQHSQHWSQKVLVDQGISYEVVLKALQEEPKQARKIRRIGNPFLPSRLDSVELRYGRNVWDMQLWNGRIYLGHGNSSNRGPAINAGPVPVISYDPAKGKFEAEFVLDEEQIDKFRIIGERLFIPGHDPRDSWDHGNFYWLGDDGWKKVRTIPDGIHAYGMLGFRDTLFSALGTNMGGKIARSSDGGQTWENLRADGTGRVFELFTLESQLYGHGYGQTDHLYRYQQGRFQPVHVNLFPDVTHSQLPMVVRSATWRGTLLYIGADNVNDHQWIPFAAYRADRIDQPQKLVLPEQVVPYDILVREEGAFILANRPRQNTQLFDVLVYQSSDLTVWTEVVRIELPTFARSFEYYKGHFFLGLGTNTWPLNEASGDIYEVVPP